MELFFFFAKLFHLTDGLYEQRELRRKVWQTWEGFCPEVDERSKGIAELCDNYAIPNKTTKSLHAHAR
jgi:hypothetical protein